MDAAIWLPSNQEIVEGSEPIDFTFKIDPKTIAVAGSSAGGLCAYLAAMHCVSPKPKALLSLYGQGGDFLVRKPKLRSTPPLFFSLICDTLIICPDLTLSHAKN